MSGDRPNLDETFSDEETEARREKLLKQLLGGKPEHQDAVAVIEFAAPQKPGKVEVTLL